MSVLAVMTARNEAGYIRVALQSLIEQGIEVVLVDHESIDGTRELAETFLGAGLLRIETLPWNGVYDLTAVLTNQQELFAIARELKRLFRQLYADNLPTLGRGRPNALNRVLHQLL